MKKGLLTMAGVLLTVSLVSAGTTVPVLAEEETTLVYGSGDYTRINPAMDEHGEINILIFNGLTAHDGDNQVVPGLAESWDFDDETNTYTFHMAEDAKWQDGEPVTAEDVKFTIEAIMDPENGSENAPNYEDVEEINVIDDHTVAFKLEDKNVAFLDYMTMAVLPKHLLEGEDMQTSDFFRNPVGTGPYKIESWDEGQAITLVKNEDYFKGEPSIDKIVFKIVPDDNAKALQLKSGELDLALLTPKDAAAFADDEAYTCYDMKTSDYRGIMFNFGNEYWQKNRDLIPAVCYGLDRQAIIDAVILGQGMPAYGPLQRNMKEIGMDVSVEIPAQTDWAGQMAFLIGWGSPFDADDHTYKVFGTDKGANYSGYSNADVDKYLTEARQSADPEVRAEAYANFQKALAEDPAYAMICYIDANYVADSNIKGIDPDTIMGHHGVGIFWNVADWTIE